MNNSLSITAPPRLAGSGKRLFAATALALMVSIGLLQMLDGGGYTHAAPSGERHVCLSGCAYESIQAAVDDAAEGDLIKVAEGTYTDLHLRDGVTQVVHVDQSVTIRGGYTTTNGFTDPADPAGHPTVLDAGRRGRVVYVASDVSVTLEGLSLVGGDGNDLGGGTGLYPDAGGGLYVDNWATVAVDNSVIGPNRSPMAGGAFVNRHATFTLRDSLITANVAISGNAGGLYLYDPAESIIHRNAILSNSAGFSGGGIYAAYGLTKTTISQNSILSNSADHDGGGVFLASEAQFLQNEVAYNTSHASGGGLKINSRGPLVAGNCVFHNWTESWGGGINVSQKAHLESNTVVSNTAGRGGGGLFLYLSEDQHENNVVGANRIGDDRSGAGIYVWGGAPQLVHTTIAENVGGDGSGLYIGNPGGPVGSVAMANTIVAAQAVGVKAQEGNTVTMAATLWGSGAWANGIDAAGLVITTSNVSGDPAFVDALGWDYHIGPASAAIDAGFDAGVYVDLDGDPRPALGAFDLGADEYWRRLYLPVVSRGYASAVR